MTAYARPSILFTAAIGVVLSAAAVWVHYQLLTSPSYTTPCDINATFNCTQVYLSRYGAIGGVPVAVGGILWSGLVWLLGAALAPASNTTSEQDRVVGGYLFSAGVVGVVVAAYYAYISFAVLGARCVFCLGTYACVMVIMWLASRLPRVPVATLPARFPADVSSLARSGSGRLQAAALLGLTVALSVFFVRLPAISAADALASAAPPMATGTPTPDSAQAATAVPPDQADAFVQYWNALPRVETHVPADGARVVIVKFQDFMCPTCKVTYEGYKPILDRFEREMPGVVRYVEKDYPLEAECNPGINGGHVYSCEAAAAVRMARKAGKGPQFEAWVWANQASLTTPFIIDGLARVAGVTDFVAQYPAQLPDIRRDALEGQALQVNGTPTFFIGGRAIGRYDPAQRRFAPDILPPPYFERAIQLALAEKNP